MNKVKITIEGDDETLRDNIFDWLRTVADEELHDMDHEDSDGNMREVEQTRVSGHTLIVEFVDAEEEEKEEEESDEEESADE